MDHENNKIIPPFDVLDNLGSSAADTVVAARDERPFLSIEDLLKRTKLSQTNVDVMRKLGVLDELDESNQMTLF